VAHRIRPSGPPARESDRGPRPSSRHCCSNTVLTRHTHQETSMKFTKIAALTVMQSNGVIHVIDKVMLPA